MIRKEQAETDALSVLRSAAIDYEGDELMETVTVMRVRTWHRLRSPKHWLPTLAAAGAVAALMLAFAQTLWSQPKVVPPTGSAMNRPAPAFGQDSEPTQQWASPRASSSVGSSAH
ncbi:MAG: hypothetical protein ACK5XS_07405 [Armatimonadota bacterium]|jgi:hypothetical protein|nr:hypothetical protein [Fimbriimonadaceae bacterium]MCZ8138403.1 hypothetical protein [Fimbriimonadaceae bacterium]